MAAPETTDERMIRLLSHGERHMKMVRLKEAAKPPSIQRISPSSSLGMLDTLPLEVVHAILAKLDFKTLLNISRACVRGIDVVKSLPEYRDVMQHAPQAVAVLGKTRVVHYYSATTVHAALRTLDCFSCGHYGAFLYLLNCRRCCQFCLWQNMSLWAIPISSAKKAFGLSAASVKTLPVMRAVPGSHEWSHSRAIRLVNVGDAKRLALAEGRTEESMAQALEARFGRSIAFSRYETLPHLIKAPITPPGGEFWIRGSYAPYNKDKFNGMASVPFPHVAEDRHVEHGLWCCGCDRLAHEYSQQSYRYQEIPAHLAHLPIPDRRDYSKYLAIMRDSPRSKADFLAHIEQCAGAQKILRGEPDDRYDSRQA